MSCLLAQFVIHAYRRISYSLLLSLSLNLKLSNEKPRFSDASFLL
jgi:hypothetical protein